MELPRQGRGSPRDATADRRAGDGDSPLYPFPEGWYFVADRRSLAKQNPIQRQWLGEDIVVWRDGGGAVSAARAVCPHLGASLGPAAGGRVRDGRLVCPFHGFAYDVRGACVATPFGPPPPSAKLTVFETREVSGLVFAWWGIDGRPPQWRLPEDPPEGDEWGEKEIRTIRFPGHPQETTENSVDLAHLRYVHGYGAVKPVGETTVEGAYLLTRFDFKRRRRIAGFTDLIYDISATAHIHGLGYSFVEVVERTIGMRSRLWVLATPVDGEVVDMVLVSQLRELRKPRRPISGLGFLPVKLRTRLMNRILMSSQVRDIRQDVTIWGNKRYRPRPSLSRSDGEIGLYRRYCRQFYPCGPDGGRRGED